MPGLLLFRRQSRWKVLIGRRCPSLRRRFVSRRRNRRQRKPRVIGIPVTTESDPLNLREEPRQDAALCGQIPRGGFVYITEKEGIWGLTLYDGVTGWLNLSYCQSGQVEVSPEVSEEATVTVYVTNTGECYHRGGCSYLHSKIPISLTDAKGSYRPCSRCHPPQ